MTVLAKALLAKTTWNSIAGAQGAHGGLNRSVFERMQGDETCECRVVVGVGGRGDATASIRPVRRTYGGVVPGISATL